jgi:hypothetical protein
MGTSRVQGISARWWQRVTYAGAAEFFLALAIASVASATHPGALTFSRHPTACGFLIALLFAGIVVGFGGGFAGAAQTIKEASKGYTTLQRLSVIGLEVRSADGLTTLKQAATRPTMADTRLAEFEAARLAMKSVGPAVAIDPNTNGPRAVDAAPPHHGKGFQIIWIVTLIATIAIGGARVAVASHQGGAAALLDTLIVVGLLVVATLGSLLVARSGSLRRGRKLDALAPDAVIAGTMRTIQLQAVIGARSPGTALKYSLAMTVDGSGFHLWEGRHPQEVWAIAAESIIDVRVHRSAQGSRGWDAISIIFRDESQSVWAIELFIRRIERPWTLVSGKFVYDLADAMRSRWLVPESTWSHDS